MELDIYGKKAGLKISMWLADEDRYANMAAQKPNSRIWEAAALIIICYHNWCRYQRVKPEISNDDFELWVDEKLSTPEGKQEIADLTVSIVQQINSLGDGVEKKMIPETQPIGEPSESLLLANVV